MNSEKQVPGSPPHKHPELLEVPVEQNQPTEKHETTKDEKKQEGKAMRIANIVFKYRRGLYHEITGKTLYNLIPQDLARALENERDIQRRLHDAQQKKPRLWFPLFKKQEPTPSVESLQRAAAAASARVDQLTEHYTTIPPRPFIEAQTKPEHVSHPVDKKSSPFHHELKEEIIALHRESKDPEIKYIAREILPDKKLAYDLEQQRQEDIERYRRIVDKIRVTDNMEKRDYLLRRMPDPLARAVHAELAVRDMWEAETAPKGFMNKLASLFKRKPQPRSSGQNLENRSRVAQAYTNKLVDHYTSSIDQNENVIPLSRFRQMQKEVRRAA